MKDIKVEDGSTLHMIHNKPEPTNSNTNNTNPFNNSNN